MHGCAALPPSHELPRRCFLLYRDRCYWSTVDVGFSLLPQPWRRLPTPCCPQLRPPPPRSILAYTSAVRKPGLSLARDKRDLALSSAWTHALLSLADSLSRRPLRLKLPSARPMASGISAKRRTRVAAFGSSSPSASLLLQLLLCRKTEASLPFFFFFTLSLRGQRQGLQKKRMRVNGKY